ncbi:MAG: hypothetical protein GC160_08050 [Acidobacteria bacterium]|nr:hypothetical protein [Acidobacteriota bacterium]
MSVRCAALLLWLAASAAGADGYVGSQACQGCHAEIWQRQAGSAHAASLWAAGEHPLAGAVAKLGNVERAPGFVARFYRAQGGLRVRMLGGGESSDMAADWAFGAGGQGVTFVSHLEGDYYLEHGLTFFASVGRLGPTPGHIAAPGSLGEAVGLTYRIEGAGGIRGCFECHSTGPAAFGADGRARLTEAGVRCEACHGPGAEHLRGGAPEFSGKVSPAAISERCGACHRRPDPSQAADWGDPWNVRHAPVYLAQSACFEGGAGSLSCVSCHSPHDPLVKTGGGSYRAVCLQCHPGAHEGDGERGDCVACHMPGVRPQPNLQFTNHWIGVYAEGSPLQPMGR